MKAFFINAMGAIDGPDGPIELHHISELDEDQDEILKPEIDWDCIRLDDHHDLWVFDDALFDPETRFARIGNVERVPLPAAVVGFEGERCVDVKLTFKELHDMIEVMPPT